MFISCITCKHVHHNYKIFQLSTLKSQDNCITLCFASLKFTSFISDILLRALSWLCVRLFCKRVHYMHVSRTTCSSDQIQYHIPPLFNIIIAYCSSFACKWSENTFDQIKLINKCKFFSVNIKINKKLQRGKQQHKSSFTYQLFTHLFTCVPVAFHFLSVGSCKLPQPITFGKTNWNIISLYFPIHFD